MLEECGEAPESWELRPGEIHVWKFALASSHADVAEIMDPLSRAEKDRAARFRFEKEQARFISGRATLRLLLGRYVNLPPEKIVFRYEAQGKPMLAGAPECQFNLSHSRDLAIAAFSRHDPVGVDLERFDPEFPRHEVAPEILSEEELHDLQILSEEEQIPFFFQMWTIKEALLKAVGKGFSIEPGSIHARLRKGRQPEIVSAPPDFNGATLRMLPIQENFAAALAVLAPAGRIGLFRWKTAY